MNKFRVSTLSALALGLAAAGAAFAQTQEGTLYEVTTKVELVGLPVQLPDQTVEVCGPADVTSERMVPHEDNCTVTDFQVEGNTASYTLVCTGETELTAKGEFEQTGPDGYRGKMHMVGTSHGQSIEMNMRFTGSRIGDCDYAEPAS